MLYVSRVSRDAPVIKPPPSFLPLDGLVLTAQLGELFNKCFNLGRASPLAHVDAVYNT